MANRSLLEDDKKAIKVKDENLVKKSVQQEDKTMIKVTTERLAKLERLEKVIREISCEATLVDQYVKERMEMSHEKAKLTRKIKKVSDQIVASTEKIHKLEKEKFELLK